MAFTAIPALPQGGVTNEQLVLLSAVKQNLEQLMGISGATQYRAVLSGLITVAPVGDLSATNLGVSGRAYTIDGLGSVPTGEDFFALANATQQILNDVTRIRNALDTLIAQLKG